MGAATVLRIERDGHVVDVGYGGFKGGSVGAQLVLDLACAKAVTYKERNGLAEISVGVLILCIIRII